MLDAFFSYSAVLSVLCLYKFRKFSSSQYLELSLTCFHVGCLDCRFPVNEVDTSSTPHSQKVLKCWGKGKKTETLRVIQMLLSTIKTTEQCTRFLLSSVLHSKLAVVSESLAGRSERRLLSHFVIPSLIFVLEASPSQ